MTRSSLRSRMSRASESRSQAKARARSVLTRIKNLVVKAMRTVFRRLGGQPRGLTVVCANRIPHGRGLGSSAAAIVSGLVAARWLTVGGDDRLDDDELLDVAASLEGHADNVAAALLGGLTVAWNEEGRTHAVQPPSFRRSCRWPSCPHGAWRPARRAASCRRAYPSGCGVQRLPRRPARACPHARSTAAAPGHRGPPSPAAACVGDASNRNAAGQAPRRRGGCRRLVPGLRCSPWFGGPGRRCSVGRRGAGRPAAERHRRGFR